MTGVLSTRSKGIQVSKRRIDAKLNFQDKEFDYAICNVTLQMVMYPEVLLREIKRISSKQIISFPNFAFVRNRIELFFRGKMPSYMIPGYRWYSTGHIHQLSIQDFKDFCQKNKMKILDQKHIYAYECYDLHIPSFISHRFPNLFASLAIFLTGE